MFDLTFLLACITFCIWGACTFTLPGRFLANSWSLAALIRSRCSWVARFTKICSAILVALPRLPVPGVNFTCILHWLFALQTVMYCQRKLFDITKRRAYPFFLNFTTIVPWIYSQTAWNREHKVVRHRAGCLCPMAFQSGHPTCQSARLLLYQVLQHHHRPLLLCLFAVNTNSKYIRMQATSIRITN